MAEKLEETGHGLKGPHWDRTEIDDLPRDFAPLRLELQPTPEMPLPLVLEVGKLTAIIGRHSSADVRLAYVEISRRHCQLSFQEGFWHIIDLNSLNGLFVNGERVHEAVLQENDVVGIGSVTMLVQGQVKRGHSLPGILRSIARNLG